MGAFGTSFLQSASRRGRLNIEPADPLPSVATFLLSSSAFGSGTNSLLLGVKSNRGTIRRADCFAHSLLISFPFHSTLHFLQVPFHEFSTSPRSSSVANLRNFLHDRRTVSRRKNPPNGTLPIYGDFFEELLLLRPDQGKSNSLIRIYARHVVKQQLMASV